MRGCAVRAE